MSIENTDTSRDGGNPGLWQAADRGEESEWLNATNPAHLRASQQAWRRAIEADFLWDGDIQCDPRTFMPLANVQLTTLGAIGGAPELRVRALAAAGLRMGLVGADGREAKSFDEVEEWKELRAAGAVPARIVPFLPVRTHEWLAEQGERLPELMEMP